MAQRNAKVLTDADRLRLLPPARRRIIQLLDELRARRVGKRKSIEEINQLVRRIRGGESD